MAPFDDSDPAEAALAIVRELERFSPTLAGRERWLLLNKRDLLDDETFQARREAVVAALNWQGPVYEIAAISAQGTDALCGDLMNHLEQLKAAEQADPELAERERQLQSQMQQEARERIAQLRASQQRARRGDDDDDDYDVDVEYAP